MEPPVIASNDIKNLFDAISPSYDRLNHLLSFNLDKTWRRKTVRQIRRDREAPFTALDLCAGTLDLTLEFLKQFPQATCEAADFSADMLEWGIQKIPVCDRPRVKIRIADALNLPYADNSFDVLLCGWGFRNFEDKPKGLKEMQRVLKPGGELLILDFFRPEGLMPKIFYHSYSRYVIPLIGRMISKNQVAYRHLHQSIATFFSSNELIKNIENNDFIDINIKNYFMQVSATVTAVKKGANRE